MSGVSSFLSTKSLQVTAVTGGTVLPGRFEGGGGIVTTDGEYLEDTYLHRGIGCTYSSPKAKFDEREVVYLGMFHDVWGHCFTDNLKHLWFLDQEEYSFLKGLPKVFTSVFPSFVPPRNFISLLEKLGLDFQDFEWVTEPTVYRKIFVPDACFFYDTASDARRYTKEYAGLIDRLVSRPLPQESPVKVFFSRAGFNSKKDYGERVIEDAFRKGGYQVVYPETLSFEEMLSCLSRCSIFAAPESSTSMNSIFLAKGTELVLVNRGHRTGYQPCINCLRELKVTVIPSHKSVFIDPSRPWNGPFFSYCSGELARFLGIRKPFFPLKEFLKYTYENGFLPGITCCKKKAKSWLKHLLRH